jgi:hypothetical protein
MFSSDSNLSHKFLKYALLTKFNSDIVNYFEGENLLFYIAQKLKKYLTILAVLQSLNCSTDRGEQCLVSRYAYRYYKKFWKELIRILSVRKSFI